MTTTSASPWKPSADPGIGLATYLRQIAADAARTVRRARIRAQSAAVGRTAAEQPEARSFYQDWGTPTTTPTDMAVFEPGQIVIVEWRDALPKEANKQRPAVVIEDACNC